MYLPKMNKINLFIKPQRERNCITFGFRKNKIYYLLGDR